MNIICKCGSKEFFTEKHGNQAGFVVQRITHWRELPDPPRMEKCAK